MNNILHNCRVMYQPLPETFKESIVVKVIRILCHYQVAPNEITAKMIMKCVGSIHSVYMEHLC